MCQKFGLTTNSCMNVKINGTSIFLKVASIDLLTIINIIVKSMVASQTFRIIMLDLSRLSCFCYYVKICTGESQESEIKHQAPVIWPTMNENLRHEVTLINLLINTKKACEKVQYSPHFMRYFKRVPILHLPKLEKKYTTCGKTL